MQTKKECGFSMVEVLVSSIIMLFVCIAVYGLILSTQKSHLTESRKVDMNQSVRGIEEFLADYFRGTGSVLTMLNTPTFLGKPPIFNGIYPLDRTDGPDGVILASGDPDAATRSTDIFNAGDTMVKVGMRDDKIYPDWKENDQGMIMRQNGYYVFKVTQVNGGDLSIERDPVYYSGLLAYGAYVDYLPKGNDPTEYPVGSPVIRLDYFSILLTKQTANGGNDLCMVTGYMAGTPVLATIVPNIEDIQYEYKLQDGSLWDYADFSKFISKGVVAVRIYTLARTEEETNLHQGSGIAYRKPRMGNRAAEMLPTGRYHYQYLEYEIALRNFNIVF